MVQSPLNYTGGKYRLLPQILPLFPERIDTFVDLFCGGCNVGINVKANRYVYNDISEALIGVFSVMRRTERDRFVNRVQEIIDEYGLSDVKTNGYAFYGCNSADGLSAYNREPFFRLRADVNASAVHDDPYYIKLYVLILYAFNNQIRFNANGEFNLPPGKRDFNQKMYEKLCRFIDLLQAQQAVFSNRPFTEVGLEKLGEEDFVYADPPYLITCASYNEKGGWTERDEYDLLRVLDSLTKRHIRFALSNVLEAKGRVNTILSEWLRERPEYRMVELRFTYNNASYQRQNKEKRTREILVLNYDQGDSR